MPFELEVSIPGGSLPTVLQMTNHFTEEVLESRAIFERANRSESEMEAEEDGSRRMVWMLRRRRLHGFDSVEDAKEKAALRERIMLWRNLTWTLGDETHNYRDNEQPIPFKLRYLR